MGLILDFIDKDLRERGIGHVLHTKKRIIEKHDGLYNDESGNKQQVNDYGNNQISETHQG